MIVVARAGSLVATLSFALAVSAPAQSGFVSLLVIDDATDRAVPDVRISVLGQAAEGVTNGDGRFFVVSPHAGRVAFVLRRLGYLPGTLMVDVRSADTTRVTFALTAAPQTLETVSVRDTMTSASPFLSGFERRARLHAGSATYITRTEIDRAHASRVTDLLRRTTSLTISDNGVIQVVMSRRYGCAMQLAVDGDLQPAGFEINTLVSEEIHGIEVYPGPASIPAQYASMRGRSLCGMIMIWTRRDK